jgi:uncharacterized SAM-binding protein YcdF (DUF218 family)
MVHLLTKLLPVPLYPLGLSLLLGAIATGLFIFRRNKAGFILLLTSFCVLGIFSLPLTEHLVIRALERRFTPPANFSSCSAVVLLGGAEVPALPPRRYPETNDFGDRIMHAGRIYKTGVAPFLIISGGYAECSARLLQELLGIDSSVIIRELDALNTKDHGRTIRKILAERHLPPDIILVTTAMHMYRSVKVLDKAGFVIQPAPTDYRADARFQWKLINFLPTASSLNGVTSALHEYYGLLTYRVLGWI